MSNSISIPFPYVEYGKQFVENGATDFLVLDHANAHLAMQASAKKEAGDDNMHNWVNFPDETPFAEEIGRVSVALLQFKDQFLFTQIQRRQEGEYSSAPRTNRPFNQLRFTCLTPQDIQQYLGDQWALFNGLVYNAQQADPQAQPDTLKPYFEAGVMRPYPVTLTRFDPDALTQRQADIVAFLVNALVQTADRPNGKPVTLGLDLSTLTWRARLEIVQAVQYWVFPLLGVITYALDYVTNQNVTLRLFPLPAKMRQPPQQVFTLGQVDTRHFPDNYYELLHALLPAERYAVELQTLLRHAPTTNVAIQLFSLVTQGAWNNPGETRLHGLQKYYALLQPESLHQVFTYLSTTERFDLLHSPNTAPTLLWALLLFWFEVGVLDAERQQVIEASLVKRFDTLTAFVEAKDYWPKILQQLTSAEQHQLLRRDDITRDLAVLILTAQFHQFEGQLANYYLFHLANPPERREDPTIVSLFQEAIRYSSVDVLAQITEQRPALDRELVKLYLAELQSGGVSTPPVVFRATSEQATGGTGIVAALLQFPSNGFAHALNETLNQGNPFLFDAILGELEKQPHLVPFHWVLTHLESPTPVQYHRLLGRLVQPNFYPALNQNTSLFQTLLTFGRERFYGGQAVLAQALPPRLKQDLRAAGLAIAPHALDFVQWWFYAELAYDTEYLAVGYKELRPILTPLAERLPTAEFRYLITHTSSDSTMSIHRACTDPATQTLNVGLLQVVVGEWMSDKPLAGVDLIALVQRLPDATVREILGRVARAQTQAASLAALAPETAQHWLQHTRGDLRQPYVVNHHDRLYARLSDLATPNEAFIWELVLYEEAPLYENDGFPDPANPLAARISWESYRATCKQWQSRLPDLGIPNTSKLACYLDLAQRPVDPYTHTNANTQRYLLDWLSQRRALLDLLAIRCVDPNAQIQVAPAQVGHLYLLYSVETDQVLHRHLIAALLAFLARPDLAQQLSELSPSLIERLHEFAQEQTPDSPAIAILAGALPTPVATTPHETAPSPRTAPPTAPQVRESAPPPASEFRPITDAPPAVQGATQSAYPSSAPAAYLPASPVDTPRPVAPPVAATPPARSFSPPASGSMLTPSAQPPTPPARYGEDVIFKILIYAILVMSLIAILFIAYVFLAS